MARTYEQIMTQMREEMKHMVHIPAYEVAAWEDQAIDAARAEAAQEEAMTGLYNKYTVNKTDGSPVDPEAQYFVLRLDTDPAARIAAMAYAEAIEIENPMLAAHLREAVVWWRNSHE